MAQGAILRAHRSKIIIQPLSTLLCSLVKVVGRCCCFFAPLHPDLLSFCGTLDFPLHLCVHAVLDPIPTYLTRKLITRIIAMG